MNWHGQINRTIWEIEHLLSQNPNNQRLRRELLRTQFLQRYEYDRSHHVARDDRSFLFMQEDKSPAALLLHGAHGTPAEMRDVGNFLYSKGFTVFCPRLVRYDVKNRMVTWESWVTAAETTLTSTLKYTDQTIVVGLSLGGTVSMLLERMHPVKGIVLLAPALYQRHGMKGAMLSIVRRLAPPLFYRMAGWNGEAVKAMDHIRKTTEVIETPALTVQAKDDHVLSSKGVRFLKKKAKNTNSETVMLEHGSHALTRGAAKEEVFEHMFQFAQRLRLIGSRSGGGRPPRAPDDSPDDRPGGRRERQSGSGRPRGRRGSRGGRGRRGSGSGERNPQRNDSPDRQRTDAPARQRNDSPDRQRTDAPARQRNDSPDRQRTDAPARQRNDRSDRQGTDAPARQRNDRSDRQGTDAPARQRNDRSDRQGTDAPARQRSDRQDRSRDDRYSRPRPSRPRRPREDRVRTEKPNRQHDDQQDRQSTESPNRQHDDRQDRQSTESPNRERDDRQDRQSTGSPNRQHDDRQDRQSTESPNRERDDGSSSDGDRQPRHDNDADNSPNRD